MGRDYFIRRVEAVSKLDPMYRVVVDEYRRFHGLRVLNILCNILFEVDLLSKYLGSGFKERVLKSLLIVNRLYTNLLYRRKHFIHLLNRLYSLLVDRDPEYLTGEDIFMKEVYRIVYIEAYRKEVDLGMKSNSILRRMKEIVKEVWNMDLASKVS